MLINLTLNYPQLLYNAYTYDLVSELLILAMPINNLFQNDYQDIFSSLLLLAPELSTMLNEYVLIYYTNGAINYLPVAIFDSYINNMNYYYSEGIIYFMMF
jgi:hypothetical protein